MWSSELNWVEWKSCQNAQPCQTMQIASYWRLMWLERNERLVLRERKIFRIVHVHVTCKQTLSRGKAGRKGGGGGSFNCIIWHVSSTIPSKNKIIFGSASILSFFFFCLFRILTLICRRLIDQPGVTSKLSFADCCVISFQDPSQSRYCKYKLPPYCKLHVLFSGTMTVFSLIPVGGKNVNKPSVVSPANSMSHPVGEENHYMKM